MWRTIIGNIISWWFDMMAKIMSKLLKISKNQHFQMTYDKLCSLSLDWKTWSE